MTEPVAREKFDPYHKWLGISPKDQPPHHYRLLAIDLFEPDPDVIAAAADKQMSFVRSFQAGKNSQLSQKILNEIAAARVCLLNAEKKAQYDGNLRAGMAAEGSASDLRRAIPLPAVVAAPAEDMVVVDEPYNAGGFVPPPMPSGSSRPSQIRKKKSSSSTIVPLAALEAMFVICAIAIIVVMSRAPETDETRTSADNDHRPPVSAEPHQAKPVSQDNKPKSAASVVAEVKENNVPSPPGNSGGAASHSSLPKVAGGDSAFGKEPGQKPPDEKRPASPPETRDPPTGVSIPPPKPELPVKTAPATPARVEAPKTAEELSKRMADAKTPEDYQNVAREALHWAGKAIDDNRKDAAMMLLRVALTAARKSNDSKLVFKVTRALTKPESVKGILAEKDQPDQSPPPDVASDVEPAHAPAPEPVISDGGGIGRTHGRSSRKGATPKRGVAGSRFPARIGLSGAANSSLPLGPMPQGTIIALQYDGGRWEDPVTHQSISPDDASQRPYRVILRARWAQGSSSFTLPTGTASRPYQCRLDRDFDSVTVDSFIFGADQHVSGTVYYRLAVTLPGQ